MRQLAIGEAELFRAQKPWHGRPARGAGGRPARRSLRQQHKPVIQ